MLSTESESDNTRIMNWPKVDDQHRHCERCNVVFRNVQLVSGYCKECLVSEAKEDKKILAKSQNKVVISAAAQVLARIKERGKDGASTPKVFNAFWSKLAESDGTGKSGQDVFGEVMAEQFNKAMGVGMTLEEQELFEASPTLRLHWFDMLNRHSRAVDDGKELDVSSLEDSELEGILIKLANKALLEDKSVQESVLSMAMQDETLRRKCFLMCLKADPRLGIEVLENNGMIVEAEAVEEKIFEQDNSVVEDDAYDPSEDEYKE